MATWGWFPKELSNLCNTMKPKTSAVNPENINKKVFVSFVKLRPKATVRHFVFFSKAQIILALVSAFSVRFEYYVSVQFVF